MSRVIRVHHSPDSDDAFMFFALSQGLVETGDITYVHELQDIESLNQRALRGELEVTAVSLHAYAHLADRYALLPHGASIGEGYGPLVVAQRPLDRRDIRGKRVAVPGLLTSAYLALRLCEPDFEPVPLHFDQIEQAVSSGDVDLGVLIHEGQLTYRDSGLHLVVDLGEWWLGETGLPLPLGGNVIRKDLGSDTIAAVSRHLRASIDYALGHRTAALDHAMTYARGLDRSSADAFVGMYVNEFTRDYGTRGRMAVRLLLDRAADSGIIPRRITVEFVDDGLASVP
jgi:1,4-dihydroxy-6-naphthoate synthase